MQAKKLTVLTEGGRVFGFGHITRCISISKHFEDFGVMVEFIVDGDDSILPILENQSLILMNWLDKKPLLQKLQESSFVLIDSLRISNDQIDDIQKLDTVIIYIDDEKRQNFLEKGFVLDWTILVDKKNYFLPKKENVTYLLGSKYTPLREAFAGSNRILINSEIKRVFISFGGSDVRNLTAKVLEFLSKNFPSLKKIVVIGDGFTNTKSIKLFQDKNTTLIYNAHAEEMSSLMNNSDIAISSGGQTLYELVSLGVPTIAILLVENARDDTEGWTKVGSIDYIGNFDDEDLLQKLLVSMKMLKKQENRQKMQNSSNFMGLNGGKLILDAVMKDSK